MEFELQVLSDGQNQSHLLPAWTHFKMRDGLGVTLLSVQNDFKTKLTLFTTNAPCEGLVEDGDENIIFDRIKHLTEQSRDSKISRLNPF